jgi:hypothetical protein
LEIEVFPSMSRSRRLDNGPQLLELHSLTLIAAAIVIHQEPKKLARQAILESKKKAREKKEAERLWQDLKVKVNVGNTGISPWKLGFV